MLRVEYLVSSIDLHNAPSSSLSTLCCGNRFHNSPTINHFLTIMSDAPAVATPPSFFHRTHPRAATGSSLQQSIASSPQRSITSSPVKKRARKWTRCICGDKTCDETIDQLELLNQTDHILHGYFRLPAQPPDSTKRLSKKRQQERSTNCRRRERFLQALPKDARFRTQDPSYKTTTMMNIAAIHYHPKVLHLCERDKAGKRKLGFSDTRLSLHDLGSN